MNTKYEIQFGKASEAVWNSAVVISKAKTFYDVLEENGLNVVSWELLDNTFVEIGGDNLPTGLIFQLVHSEATSEEEEGEICT